MKWQCSFTSDYSDRYLTKGYSDITVLKSNKLTNREVVKMTT